METILTTPDENIKCRQYVGKRELSVFAQLEENNKYM